MNGIDGGGDRELTLRFRLVDESPMLPADRGLDVTPHELSEFLELVDDITRSIVVEEAGNLLAQIDVPSEARLDAMREIHDARREVSSAARFEGIHRGSVVVDVSLLASQVALVTLAVTGFLIRQTLGDAWRGTTANARLQQFFERVFERAGRKAEEAVASAPRRGRAAVRPVSVERIGSEQHPMLEITLVRIPTRAMSKADWDGAAELLRSLGVDRPSDPTQQ